MPFLNAYDTDKNIIKIVDINPEFVIINNLRLKDKEKKSLSIELPIMIYGIKNIIIYIRNLRGNKFSYTLFNNNDGIILNAYLIHKLNNKEHMEESDIYNEQ